MTAAAREAAIRAAMQAAQARLYQLDDEGRAALTRLYTWALKQIEQEIRQRAGGDGSLALEQLDGLRRQVLATLGRLEEGRNSALNDGLAEAARVGAETLRQAGIEGGPIMRIPDEAVRFVRHFVGSDGLQLSDRLWRIDRGARDAVVNAIERALVMGHSASQAAADFLANGQAVPADVQQKKMVAGAEAVVRETTAIMVGDGKGGGGALAQSARVFRTEINRANGVAYMKQAMTAPGFNGIRFTLSPQHPRPDVCDELAYSDTFGLGAGVYPDMEEFLKVWPAHPNTFSFPVAVFST